MRRLYEDSFYEWKLMSLKPIEKPFRSHFKFHSNPISLELMIFTSYY